MSKPALSFIILALLAMITDYLLPTEALSLNGAAKIATATFIVLSVIALVVGRRIKFDPILR